VTTEIGDKTSAAGGSDAAYVVAGALAMPALWALSAAAPGGGQWRWLEYPVGATCLAFVAFLVASRRRAMAAVVAVPIATALLFGAWNLVATWHERSKLGVTSGPRAAYYYRGAFEMLAPWLIGAAYGVLAALTIRGRAAGRAARDRRLVAAAWLLCMSGLVAILCSRNESWLTFENIGNKGTFRSSAPWPDTKIFCMVLAGATMIIAVAWAVYAAVRAKRRTRSR
jgi:hypothetical protein